MNIADCWSGDSLFCDYGAVTRVISHPRWCQHKVAV